MLNFREFKKNSLEKTELVLWNLEGYLCTKLKGLFSLLLMQKIIWTTFGCKGCHSDPIAMKPELELDVLPPIDMYTKFQMDISKLEERA